MIKSTSVRRRAILSHLFDHLKSSYDIELPRETLAGGLMSDRDIDAVLAFKSDAELDELRSALSRLENGTYGFCLRCRHQMSSSLLTHDPARRICPQCEREVLLSPAIGMPPPLTFGIHYP